MKLSENKIIKTLDRGASLTLILFALFLLLKLFSTGAPKSSHSIKGYGVYEVIAKPKTAAQSRSLRTWFTGTVIVQPNHRALIDLRFRSNAEIFSLPALAFQSAQLCYWLLIGFLLLCIKKLFASFRKDQVFTNKNASLIMISSLVLMILPISNWVNQALFLNCINKLGLNDSAYVLSNGAHLLGTETLIGIALLAFGFAFKAGVDMKNENDSFI